MKIFAVIGLLGLVVCGSALAKFSVSLNASDRTPALGQRVTLVVRSERALDYDLRLIAVAPGQDVFHVVATITGDTGHPDPNVARHGFEINLKRIASNRWRGVARFRRPAAGALPSRAEAPWESPSRPGEWLCSRSQFTEDD